MAKRKKEVDPLRVIDLLKAHITPTLCRTVFGQVRKTERQRVWTLEALVRFLDRGGLAGADRVKPGAGRFAGDPGSAAAADQGQPQGCFQRCRDLRPAVFAEVFRRFTARLLHAAPPRYAAEMVPVAARFATVVLLDGSR